MELDHFLGTEGRRRLAPAPGRQQIRGVLDPPIGQAGGAFGADPQIGAARGDGSDFVDPELLFVLSVIDQPVAGGRLGAERGAGLADVVSVQKAEPGELLDRRIVDVGRRIAVIGAACQGSRPCPEK